MLALPYRNVPIVNDKPLTKIVLDDTSPIGLHIRKKRLELKMNQKDVAKIIGVSEDCIMLWENSHISGTPMVHSMPNIIAFLGYNPILLDLHTLSGKIKDYRFRHGLTTKGFGKLIGVDGSTVGAWEAGKSPPKFHNLESINKLLGS